MHTIRVNKRYEMDDRLAGKLRIGISYDYGKKLMYRFQVGSIKITTMSLEIGNLILKFIGSTQDIYSLTLSEKEELED